MFGLNECIFDKNLNAIDIIVVSDEISKAIYIENIELAKQIISE